MFARLIFILFTISVAAEPNRGGTIDFSTYDASESLKRFEVPEGFEVQLAADSKELGIANPLAINFDNQGRLWVLCWPDYPQMKAGKGTQDQLIVLEDVDGDGKMDKKTLFSDDLHAPTGFEFGDGGVYIAEPPFLTFLKDTDGDGKADTRQKVLHGFGTEDSHHTISAFHWGGDGGLYFGEGNFHHARIETPYGIVKVNNGAFYRYEPRSGKLEDIVNYGCWNPWGQIFDKWGQHFIADASPGNNYYATALSGKVNFPAKHSRTKIFTGKVRPTAGCEIISSRNFPDDMQGNFIIANCIGFHGIKMHKFKDEGAGFSSDQLPDLLKSTDPNFRPVDLKFAPDGSLYICDWFNPLIGHMQYPFSDKRRDNQNGRIWRLVYTKKPLVKKPKIVNASIPQLLENLKLYEDKARYATRRELRERPRAEALNEMRRFMASQKPGSEGYEALRLEILWLYQSLHSPNPGLLKKILKSKDYRVRAAAARVLRYWKSHFPDYLKIHSILVQDSHPRVRLQAVVNLSYENDINAVKTALSTRVSENDYYLNYVLKETYLTLEPVWRQNPEQFNVKEKTLLYQSVSDEALLDMTADKDVYSEIILRPEIVLNAKRNALQKLSVLERRSYQEIVADFLNSSKRDRFLSFLYNLDRSDIEPVVSVLKNIAEETPSVEVIAALIKGGEFDYCKKFPLENVINALSKMENFESSRYESFLLLALNGNRAEAEAVIDLLSKSNHVSSKLKSAAVKHLNDKDLNSKASQFFLSKSLKDLSDRDLKEMTLSLTSVINSTNKQGREQRSFNVIFQLAKKLESVGGDSSIESLRQAIKSASKDIIWDISKKKLKHGANVYKNACVKCHQTNGTGIKGAFPPLANSDWLKKSDEALIKVVLHGLMGPIEVNGQKYNSVMAPLGNMLNDSEIAAVLSYVKNSWGNRGREVHISQVSKVRKQVGQRGLWTIKELE